MAFGEGLMIIGSGILAVYPIFIAILLDILILIAMIKFAENSKHPFLTGFLLGSMFNNRQSYNSSPGSDYLALAILAPLNAGLAVLLCLYLGINLPLALMVCLGPLAVALALIVIGAIINYIDIGRAVADFARGVDQAAGSLWTYLTERKPAAGIGLLLGVSLVVGVALLFHFGLPFYAFAVGFATVGALILLGLGYIARFAFKIINEKAEAGAGGGQLEVEGRRLDRRSSQDLALGGKRDYERVNQDEPRKEGELDPDSPSVEGVEGREPKSASTREPGAPE